MAVRTLTLRAAVSEIQAAYRNREVGQPFFFVVGAGLSAPAVPLAGAIADQCRGQVGPEDDGFAPSQPLDAYSYWFDRAYPQPADRQRYLKTLIQNKPIPNAALRLAHVLASGLMSDLVVTSNFDDFITRALALFGAPYVHCDHPSTVDRIDLVTREIKVVHVHGSYKFYDCRNIRDELEERARPSYSTTRTMAAFLDRALGSSSPIVIGYSGWDGDVIMSALRRRLEGASLPYRLYWFAYTPEDLSNLHARCPWLTEHPDVRFAVPDTAQHRRASEAEPTSPVSVSVQPSLLPAQLVFEELSRRFELREPELTRDPVRFFARQARAAFAAEVEEREQGNLYSFSTVVARLERAAKLEADDFRMHRAAISDLEPVRRLVRESQYSEALDTASALAADLEDNGCIELFHVLRDLIRSFSLDDDGVLRAASLALSVAERTPAINETIAYRSERVDLRLAMADALLRLNRPEVAIAELDKLLEESAGDNGADVQARLRVVRASKARALAIAERLRDAVREYDALIPDLRRHPEEKWILLQAQYNRALHLAALGHTDEALIELARFAEEHRGTDNTITQVLVAGALQAHAQVLAAQGRPQEAIHGLSDLAQQFGSTDSIRLGRVVAGALIARASLENERLRLSEAARSLDAFDHLCRRLGLHDMLPDQVIVEATELRRRLQDLAPRQQMSD